MIGSTFRLILAYKGIIRALRVKIGDEIQHSTPRYTSSFRSTFCAGMPTTTAPPTTMTMSVVFVLAVIIFHAHGFNTPWVRQQHQQWRGSSSWSRLDIAKNGGFQDIPRKITQRIDETKAAIETTTNEILRTPGKIAKTVDETKAAIDSTANEILRTPEKIAKTVDDTKKSVETTIETIVYLPSNITAKVEKTAEDVQKAVSVPVKFVQGTIEGGKSVVDTAIQLSEGKLTFGEVLSKAMGVKIPPVSSSTRSSLEDRENIIVRGKPPVEPSNTFEEIKEGVYSTIDGIAAVAEGFVVTVEKVQRLPSDVADTQKKLVQTAENIKQDFKVKQQQAGEVGKVVVKIVTGEAAMETIESTQRSVERTKKSIEDKAAKTKKSIEETAEKTKQTTEAALNFMQDPVGSLKANFFKPAPLPPPPPPPKPTPAGVIAAQISTLTKDKVKVKESDVANAVSAVKGTVGVVRETVGAVKATVDVTVTTTNAIAKGLDGLKERINKNLAAQGLLDTTPPPLRSKEGVGSSSSSSNVNPNPSNFFSKPMSMSVFLAKSGKTEEQMVLPGKEVVASRDADPDSPVVAASVTSEFAAPPVDPADASSDAVSTPAVVSAITSSVAPAVRVETVVDEARTLSAEAVPVVVAADDGAEENQPEDKQEMAAQSLKRFYGIGGGAARATEENKV